MPQPGNSALLRLGMIMPVILAGFAMIFLALLMATFAAPHVFGAFSVAIPFVAAIGVKDHIFQRLAGTAMGRRTAATTGTGLTAALVFGAFALMATIGMPTVVSALMPTLGIRRSDETDPGDRAR